jgi:hypothetical protein
MLVEHLLRDFGGEVRVGEFRGDLFELGFDLGDLFADAGLFGVHIDQTVERQEKLAERRQSRWSAFFRLEGRIDLQGLRIEKDAQDLDFVRRQLGGRFEHETHLLVDVEGALQATTQLDGLVFVVRGLFVLGKDAEVGEFVRIERFRPRGEHDALPP